MENLQLELSFQLIRFNPIGRAGEGLEFAFSNGFQLIRFNPIGRVQIQVRPTDVKSFQLIRFNPIGRVSSGKITAEEGRLQVSN